MEEPSRRSSRLALAGLLGSFLLAGGGFILGRSTADPRQQPASPPAPSAPKAERAPLPLPKVQGPLGRAELLEAAALAADAFAAGEPLPREVSVLSGRQFDLRLPFGCAGPVPPEVEEIQLGWRYDAEAESLRVRALPQAWPLDPWAPGSVSASSAPAIEAIEGFWIARPWTSVDTCPGRPGNAPQLPGPAPVQTLGIAQFFAADGSRVGRRDGEAYQAVEAVAPEALNVNQGFRLRLRGRISPAPGGGPIVCRAPAGPDARPVCLVSALFDQVAIENPATNATLATWDTASRVP